MTNVPCPDCKRIHIHALYCPNPEPLPNFDCGQDKRHGRAIEVDHAR